MALIKNRVIDITGVATDKEIKINIDDEALFELINECQKAIVAAHPNFRYKGACNYFHYITKLYIILNDFERNGLHVSVTGNEIDPICNFILIQKHEDIFPNCLSKGQKLAVQKLITKKIGEEAKTIKNLW